MEAHRPTVERRAPLSGRIIAARPTHNRERALVHSVHASGRDRRTMKLTRYLAIPVFLLTAAFSVSSQEILAPNVSGTSVQGGEVDLSEFKGAKNVLVVFYRMHT